MSLVVIYSPRSPGTCRFAIKLALILVNGKTGRPDFGAWLDGNPMKLISTRNAFVAQARQFIPLTHPLRTLGWHVLPTTGPGIGSWELAGDVEMPAHPSLNE